ncbi:MAG TPA: glycosyltransferase [Chthoniobacteraceae bacterium]|jgi:GT2 family glycosyltransferase|nr:glycosyltransferase [Chthoniobacteraceae bacterium]
MQKSTEAPRVECLTLSVIVVTLGRPKCLKRCLEHLREQSHPVSQIIVVDGDPERSAQPISREFPEAIYVHNSNGFGRMTASRNLGLAHASGAVIAYVDDDAYAAPEWAANLLLPYADENIGAVGGQVLMGTPGETKAAGEIGRITPWGEVIGNFGAELPGLVDVDHLMGCNMSFRRDLLIRFGGFSEFFPTGRCSTFEEVDLCLKIAKMGRRVVFTSRASLHHEGAPRRVGARGDINYIFGATRNLTTVLLRNRGVFSMTVPAFMAQSIWRAFSTLSRDLLRAFARFLAPFAGIAVALISIGRRRARPARKISGDPAKNDGGHPRKPFLFAWLREEPNSRVETES